MKFKSLIIQISFVIILALTTSLLLFGSYQYYRSKVDFNKKLNEQLKLTSHRLTNSLKLPTYNIDEEAIVNTILSEMHDKSIVGITLSNTDRQNSIQSFVRQSPNNIKRTNSPLKLPYTITAHSQITYQGENLGTLQVFITTRLMEERLTRILFSTLIQIIILDILLIVICIIILKIKFVNPIVTLTGKSTQIAQGDLEQPIDTFSDNEIGILASSLEKMRQAICDKISSLDQLNQELKQEIIERKQIENELKDSRENIRITMNSIGDAVIATDTSGIITQMNPVAEKLTGWSFADCQGHPLKKVFMIMDSKTRSPIEDPVSHVITTCQPFNLATDTILTDKDGREKQISDSCAPILNSDGKAVGAVLIFRDTTDKNRLEEQLRHAQKMDSIGQLAGGIAHDFNNMLAGITGAAQLLANQTDDNSKANKFINLILNAADKAADLTRKLLDFSRKGKLFSIAVDIHDTIQVAVDILERSIDKRIRIDLHLNAKNKIITGDPSQLQNLFLNLGLNARDAMPAGGTLTITTENVTLHELKQYPERPVSVAEQYIKINFRDTGMGINPDIIKHIFDPFFTTKKVGEGTGLGLAAVYGAIKEHKGAIHVESELDKGCEFIITLPTADHNLVPQSDKTELLDSPIQGTILLADDEEIIQEVAYDMLCDLGLQVIIATNGVEAVEIFKKEHEHIDLVILDLIMPKLNGGDTFYKMKEIQPDVKVLFSSGFTQNEGVETLLKDGGAGFIHKPYNHSELSLTIAKALGQKQPLSDSATESI